MSGEYESDRSPEPFPLPTTDHPATERTSAVGSIPAPSIPRLGIPPAADVPAWVRDILQRQDDGQEAARVRHEDIKDFVARRFDDVRLELIAELEKEKAARIDADKALALDMSRAELHRSSVPAISLSISIVNLVILLNFLAWKFLGGH